MLYKDPVSFDVHGRYVLVRNVVHGHRVLVSYVVQGPGVLVWDVVHGPGILVRCFLGSGLDLNPK